MSGPEPIALLKSGVGIYKIAENLYQSAEPEGDADWDTLWKLADVVVGLNTPPMGEFPGLPASAMVVRWSIEDGPLPNLEVLRGLVEMLANLLENGHRVLIFCGAGVNRSGLVAAMVVRQLSGESGRRAADHVRIRRPGSLINATFNMYLHALPDLDDELGLVNAGLPEPGEIEGL